MTTFCCWFDPSTSFAQTSSIAAEPSRVIRAEGACGVAGGSQATDPDFGVTIAGTPRWLNGALAEQARSNGDAAALLAGYRQYGPAVVTRLGGAFTLAVVEPARGRILAANDRMGQCALYFAALPDGVAIADRPETLLADPRIDGAIDPQSIHDYLHFHMIPAPRTIYAGVYKLPAAHALHFDSGTLRTERYWLPTFSEESTNTEGLAAELRATLGTSVGQHAGPNSGAFLSGGLDSSTIAGLFAGHAPEHARAFTIGFEAAGYDEVPFARTAAEHFGLPLTEYYVTPEDIGTAVRDVVGSFAEPFGNSSAIPAYFCALRAKEAGITCMLAGDGGDELFAGNARYAKQGVFEHYARLPAALRHRAIEPLLNSAIGGLPGLRKVRRYVEQARVPLPDRLDSYNSLERLGRDTVFEPGFARAIDREGPTQHLRELYALPESASTLNRMLFLDWQITLADNDLRKVSQTCQLAGVEVAFPMLDSDVVALSCRIPSADKLRRGRLRHFYKEAFGESLPPTVLNKRKHGFGLPFGVWLRDDPQLHELARSGFAAVRERGWLQKSFLDDLLNVRLHEHPAYYGDFVWVIMALGLWLERVGR